MLSFAQASQIESWTATHTIHREFQINNGPPEDLSILERLVEAGFVVRWTERTYVAAVYPLKIKDGGRPH